MAQLHTNVGRGGAYEAFVDAVLSLLASMIPVPREEDFGIDFYCLPRVPLVGQLETVAELCAIQVKGGSAADGLFFGGRKNKGPWREQNLRWFSGLDVPLYVAAVDREFSRVDLFSTAPALAPFWRGGTPFRIDLTLGDSDTVSVAEAIEPTCQDSPGEEGNGDGKVWDVNLGPPILRLTLPDLNDEATRQARIAVLRTWIVADRVSFLNMRRHLPRLTLIDRWRTNWVPSPTIERQWSFWRELPGMNLDNLIAEAGPIVGILAKHLQAQGDTAGLATWRPILQWLKDRGVTDGLVDEMCN